MAACPMDDELGSTADPDIGQRKQGAGPKQQVLARASGWHRDPTCATTSSAWGCGEQHRDGQDGHLKGRQDLTAHVTSSAEKSGTAATLHVSTTGEQSGSAWNGTRPGPHAALPCKGGWSTRAEQALESSPGEASCLKREWAVGAARAEGATSRGARSSQNCSRTKGGLSCLRTVAGAAALRHTEQSSRDMKSSCRAGRVFWSQSARSTEPRRPEQRQEHRMAAKVGSQRHPHHLLGDSL